MASKGNVFSRLGDTRSGSQTVEKLYERSKNVFFSTVQARSVTDGDGDYEPVTLSVGVGLG